MKAKVILSFVIAVLFFSVAGYFLSDDYYFNRLIAQEKIKTPDDALEYVCKATTFANDEPVPGLTPRYLLTVRKHLYCDESAVLLATVVHEMGYNTRLVDLTSNDNRTRHTILEIYQNGDWITYDTVQKIRGASYHELIEGYESEDWRSEDRQYRRSYKVCKNKVNHAGMLPRFRKYPNVYNWFVQNNYFIKHFVLWLRGIPG